MPYSSPPCSAKRSAVAAALFGAVSAFPAPVTGADPIPGPVPARVLKVIDGDTLKVDALIWIGQRLTINARIRGIDTPELRGRCSYETEYAEIARTALEDLTTAGSVRLINIDQDKFGGRIVADVMTLDGRDIASIMLKRGLARPYGGGRRESWCAESG